MNKLIFKFFYLRIFLLILITIFILSGCNRKTGALIYEIPSENAEKTELYFCPQDDCGFVFEKKIKSANISVHCAFFDIELEKVINALAEKSKDTNVKVVIDESNYNEQTKGEGVRLDKSNGLMHNKFCVIDSYFVITGSFNPTYNDNYNNNNNVIIIYSNTLAKNYEEEFNELWNGNFGNGDIVRYPRLIVNNKLIENYFCPEDCQLSFSAINTNSGLYKIINLIRN
ncbi:DUF1669 domain-containing protein, partial [Candidatus Woesearchaeota archaeon]|nr:DUF1669 domain-containing protein [Candidatus Woesearchaeota archaeon]